MQEWFKVSFDLPQWDDPADLKHVVAHLDVGKQVDYMCNKTQEIDVKATGSLRTYGRISAELLPILEGKDMEYLDILADFRRAEKMRTDQLLRCTAWANLVKATVDMTKAGGIKTPGADEEFNAECAAGSFASSLDVLVKLGFGT